MPKHASRAHAKYFSPSSADRWIDCTASPKYVESLNLPATTSDAAEEGTAAHELLEKALKTGKHPLKFKGKKFNKTWEADQTMCEFVGIVWEWAQSYVLKGYTLYTERRVNIAVTGDAGTLDMALLKDGHLIVGDLKYGKGYEVEVKKNRQMRLYACGFLDEEKLWHKVQRITLVVCQPRIKEQPQEWDDTIEGLTYFRVRVAAIVEQIRNDNTEFKASEKSCHWCPARAQCKSYARHASEAASLDFANIVSTNGIVMPDCQSLTLEERVNIYLKRDMIMAWLKTIGEDLYAKAHAGETLPLLKLVESKANRKWKSESDTINRLLELGMAPDAFAPRRLAGLAEVGRLFDNKSERELFLQANTFRPPGKLALVPEGDPRMAVASGHEFDTVNPEQL